WDLPDFGVRGPWCRDLSIQEILSEGLKVGGAADARVLEQSLDFGRKYQGTAPVPVVEGLLPGPVARQDQSLGALIPERNGEHSVQLADKIRPQVLVQVNDDFAVGARPQSVAAIQEPPAELAIVVN